MRVPGSARACRRIVGERTSLINTPSTLIYADRPEALVSFGVHAVCKVRMHFPPLILFKSVVNVLLSYLIYITVLSSKATYINYFRTLLTVSSSF
jgi:hypothetical protein